MRENELKSKADERKERLRKYDAEYRKNNPEKIREITLRYWARRIERERNKLQA
ncbi:MAG: hypothetical protein ACD_19C00033G0003 [uncultured bacterium]|nr:MAG: hypothetical protein ACD_19C00033G0003 [uncultured bacterium]